MAAPARYDGLVEWYDDFRPALIAVEDDALERLLGTGGGRCLDVGCGTGVALTALTRLGWSVVGVDVSEDLLRAAGARGMQAELAPGDSLPFADRSLDAAVSIWTHTDVDDFPAVVREIARVLRPCAPFVYLGAHPCFVGPHSRFVAAEGTPELHPGYRRAGRYTEAPGVSPHGLRARVGASHLPLGKFMDAFLGSGFVIERFEEPADLDHPSGREYPHMVALRARRGERLQVGLDAGAASTVRAGDRQYAWNCHASLRRS